MPGEIVWTPLCTIFYQSHIYCYQLVQCLPLEMYGATRWNNVVTRGGVLPSYHLHRSCYRYVQSYNGLMWSKIVAWASTNITARNSTFYFFCCNQSCIHNILSTMNTMSPYGAITLSPLTHLSSCRITSLWFCRLTAIVSYRHRWFSYSMFTTLMCVYIYL